MDNEVFMEVIDYDVVDVAAAAANSTISWVAIVIVDYNNSVPAAAAVFVELGQRTTVLLIESLALIVLSCSRSCSRRPLMLSLSPSSSSHVHFHSNYCISIIK